MLNRTTFVRETYDAIQKNLHCSVDEGDYERIKPKIENLKELARIQNRAIAVYDLYRREFLLKIDTHISLLGYTNTEMIPVNNIAYYHEMVHTDDLPFLCDSEIRMYDYLRDIKDDSKKDYKLVYDYRVRAKDGSYIRFLHQLVIYEVDKAYHSWLLLIISDVLSTSPANESPRRFLINTRTQKVCLFNEESGIKSSLITRREKEVLELIEAGFDSTGIAARLFVSVNTINNHRQHILEKTHTRNSSQAIAYLKCIGLL